MDIVTGLFEHLVLQRNAKNVSEAAFSGTAAAAGTLTATVTQNGKAVTGLTGLKLGSVKAGVFKATLKGLPAGGPYSVELAVCAAGGAVLERRTVKDVLVGDVWILGGQSNMQGVGDMHNGLKAEAAVRAFFMDDHWGVAQEPIHDLSKSVDPVHTDLCGGVRPGEPGRYCACPGLSFAQKMRELSGVPQGVIACGHGGTSMAQWDPKLKKLGGKSLYGAMVRRFTKNGGKVAGMIWYQGCSDANPEAAALYTKRMKEFVAACRRDFGFAAMPFVLVQISRVVGWGAGNEVPWNSIQDQERRLPQVIKRCLTVPAIDLSLDDSIHISGSGQVVLGRRLAQAMDVLVRGQVGGKPPIELKKVSIALEDGRACANVTVEFDNVVGQLCAGSRPCGFTLTESGPSLCVFDIKLDGNKAIVRTSQGVAKLGEMSLHYGYGTDPYCNITDAAGRSLPVFGPLALGKPRAATPFIRTVRVSDYQPGAGKLEKLALPKNLNALKLKSRTFGENFCTMHAETMTRGDQDNVLFYACAIDCAEPMKLALLTGYDGPVKIWMDGKLVYHDPNGINPAILDAHAIKFSAARGKHEVVVALGTNSGKAWGVFLRFERLDVSRAKLKAGPEAWGLPTVLG